eukprot:11483345-Heterocapsa_arctica.AAC.1
MVAHTTLNEWQRKQWRRLQSHLKTIGDVQGFFRDRRPAAAKIVSPDVNPGALDCLSRSMGWPDLGLPWLPTVGAQLVGDIPECGIFR